MQDEFAPRPGIVQAGIQAALNGVNNNQSKTSSPSTWRRQPLQTGNVRNKTLSYARSIVASIEEEHDSLYTSMDDDSPPESPREKKSVSVPRLRVSVGPMPNRVPVVPPIIDYSSFPSQHRTMTTTEKIVLKPITTISSRPINNHHSSTTVKNNNSPPSTTVPSINNLPPSSSTVSSINNLPPSSSTVSSITSRDPSPERTTIRYGSRQGGPPQSTRIQSNSSKWETSSNTTAPSAPPPPPPLIPETEKVKTIQRHRSSSQPLTRERLRQLTDNDNTRPAPPSDTTSISSRGSSSFLASRVHNERTNGIRSQWEHKCQRDEHLAREEALRVSRSRGYSFPKWRSNDALSASLVASNANGTVKIPADSKIPEERQRKMLQTEFEARETKILIHGEVQSRRPLHRGKSIDSINMQMDYSPWYDEGDIKGGIERESIANIQKTRARFESINNTVPNTRFIPQQNGGSGPSHPRKLIIDDRSSPPSEQRFTPPQCQPINAVPSTLRSSNMSLSSRLSPEEARLVQYLRQNARIASGLGISIPQELMSDVINSSSYSDSHYNMEIPSHNMYYRRMDMVARNEQEISPGGSSMSSERYGRRPLSPSARFNRKHEIPREIPENRRAAAEDLRGRYGPDLIAAEMRLQREREDELRRSRSELGLPDLNDTLQLWRNGYRGLSTNCLRSATSFDQGLNHPYDTMSKAQSITEMSYAGR